MSDNTEISEEIFEAYFEAYFRVKGDGTLDMSNPYTREEALGKSIHQQHMTIEGYNAYKEWAKSSSFLRNCASFNQDGICPYNSSPIICVGLCGTECAISVQNRTTKEQVSHRMNADGGSPASFDTSADVGSQQSYSESCHCRARNNANGVVSTCQICA